MTRLDILYTLRLIESEVLITPKCTRIFKIPFIYHASRNVTFS
jgi:hypothetical protein